MRLHFSQFQFSVLDFKYLISQTELSRTSPPDGFLLVYSVVDRPSFQRVEMEIRRLQEMDLLRTKAVVIVANKIDLARSRSISTQGDIYLWLSSHFHILTHTTQPFTSSRR